MLRLPHLALAALALVPLTAPAIARAQSDTSTVAPPSPPVTEARPLVLVVDPGPVRVSSDRLLRVIRAATRRDVVRITDARAEDSSGTVTIAYEGSGGWLVRFDSRGRSAVRHERIRRPGALDASLSAAVLHVLGDLETAATPARAESIPAPPIPGPTSQEPPSAEPGDRMLVMWVDEILDPFASLPRPAARDVVTYSEVLDPFGPAAPGRAGWSEVIDPWDR